VDIERIKLIVDKYDIHRHITNQQIEDTHQVEVMSHALQGSRYQTQTCLCSNDSPRNLFLKCSGIMTT